MAREFEGATKPTSVENDEHLEVNGVGVKRVLSSGFDGSDLQDLTTDADGHLQVDVLSGGGGGTLRTDGAAVNAADTATLILGTDGSNYQLLKTAADGAVQIGDNAGAITVDGTVTANATLAAETTKVIGTVNISASQTVTAAQATAGNLNCTEASAADIKTAVQVIDNCISGSEAQVDVVAALPAGTNIIGAVKRDVINYTPIRKYYAYTGAVTDGIVWSPAAGNKWVITDIIMSTSAAATITFEEDKTGGDAVVFAVDLAANGGVSSNLQTPIYGEEDDADLVVTTTAGNVKIIVAGYEIN